MSNTKLREKLRDDLDRTGFLWLMKGMKQMFDARLDLWESDRLRIVRRAGELVEVPIEGESYGDKDGSETEGR